MFIIYHFVFIHFIVACLVDILTLYYSSQVVMSEFNCCLCVVFDCFEGFFQARNNEIYQSFTF